MFTSGSAGPLRLKRSPRPPSAEGFIDQKKPNWVSLYHVIERDIAPMTSTLKAPRFQWTSVPKFAVEPYLFVPPPPWLIPTVPTVAVWLLSEYSVPAMVGPPGPLAVVVKLKLRSRLKNLA